MKETFDPSENRSPLHLRADYRAYRFGKFPEKKKERLSRGNKILLLDLAMIAFFGMMIFLFRPYLISPNRVGDFKFSASADVSGNGFVRVILTAEPVTAERPKSVPPFSVTLFYEGIEWSAPIDNLSAVATEKGFQWTLLPFPKSGTSKISLTVSDEDESTEFIITVGE